MVFLILKLNGIFSVDDYIKQHKEICYCEAIILPDGKIADARPSHIYKLIELSNKTKDEIDKLMPMFASPLEWLVSYTGCIAVWYNSFIFVSITDKQRKSLQRLVNTNVLSKALEGTSTNEYLHCKSLESFSDTGELDYKEKETVFIYKERV